MGTVDALGVQDGEDVRDAAPAGVRRRVAALVAAALAARVEQDQPVAIPQGGDTAGS